MIACGYCGECCGYWSGVCGYWRAALPAVVRPGQTTCCGLLRVVAGIKSNPNAYTRTHTHMHSAGNGTTTRHYPHYPQRASDLRFCLRVLDCGTSRTPRGQYPQTPQTWIARPRPQWEALSDPSPAEVRS